MKGIEMSQVYEPKQKSAGTGGHPLVATGVFSGFYRHEYGKEEKKYMFFMRLEECVGLPRNDDGQTSIQVSEETCKFVDENFQIGDLVRLPVSVSAYSKNNSANISIFHMKHIAMPMKVTK